jgi:hypothetical protein
VDAGCNPSGLLSTKSATEEFMKKYILLLIAAFVLSPVASGAAQMIGLTQTGCQFLESEGIDHKFVTHSSHDCEAINAKTGKKRLAVAKPMQLSPGEYIFRVKNRDVPYVLGFWLRGTGLSRLTLPTVSGGGIKTGEAQDYAVTLKEGEYRYSCPLNPTPDYTLIVK